MIFSCQSKENIEKLNEMQTRMPEVPTNENEIKGKEWLTKSIEGHFANDNPKMIMMTTPNYYEFKLDALNLELGLPESISKEEFTKKWSERFDLTKPDIYNAFLIPVQDFGKIKVNACEFIKNENDTLIYNVEMSDLQFNTNYKSTIKIVPAEKGFLVADVYQL